MKFKKFLSKVPAFSLLEMLVASTMSAIIFGSALTVVSHLYYSQTRVELAQNFYAETRLLQERLSHTVRNSTIDYDRYWYTAYNGEPITDPLVNDLRTGNTGSQYDCGLGEWVNNYENFNSAEQITYVDIFYWDTQNSLIITDPSDPDDHILDARLGKANVNTTNVNCKRVLQNTISTLFLMSGDRTYRTKLAFRPCDDSDCDFQARENVIVLERELGHDEDNDGIIDHWGTNTEFRNGACRINTLDPVGEVTDSSPEIFGDKSNPDFCDMAHEEVIISPVALEIMDLSFTVEPEADPYLNYEEDEFLKHPFVLWSMDIMFRDFAQNGYTESRAPRMSFQTSVSTRVYGDTRQDVTNYIYRHCEDNGLDPLCKP